MGRSKIKEPVATSIEEELPLGKAIRRYPVVVGWCLALTSAIIGWGYDLVIVGAIAGTDEFLKAYGTWSEEDDEYMIPSMWLSLWLAIPPLGAAIGSVFVGWLQDKIGRRYSLLIGSIVSAIAVTLLFFSAMPKDQDMMRAVFSAGMMVQGLSVGIIKVTCLTFVSENVPTAIRGSAMGLFPAFNLVGQLLGLLVVYIINDIKGSTGYLAAFGSQWALALAPFIVSIFMPESPSHLLRQGKDEQALHAATRLFAPRVDPTAAIKTFRETIEQERAFTAGVSYITCFKTEHLRRTLISILAIVLPTMFGLDLLSNANVFLKSNGMDSGISILFMMGGIVAGIVGNGVGMWILSKVGRRSATLTSLAVACVLWGGLGVIGFWESETLAFVGGGLLVGVIVVCGMGAWPAGYAIVGETSSLQLRAKTEALGNVAGQASSIAMSTAIPYLFQSDGADLGFKTGFVYCGLCLVAVAMTWFWLPEMKGRSMAEIDHMFELKLPTRQFKHFKMDQADEVHPLVDADTAYHGNSSSKTLYKPLSDVEETEYDMGNRVLYGDGGLDGRV